MLNLADRFLKDQTIFFWKNDIISTEIVKTWKLYYVELVYSISSENDSTHNRMWYLKINFQIW